MKTTLLIFIVTLIAAVLATVLTAYVTKADQIFQMANIQTAIITAAFNAILLPRILRRS